MTLQNVFVLRFNQAVSAFKLRGLEAGELVKKVTKRLRGESDVGY